MPVWDDYIPKFCIKKLRSHTSTAASVVVKFGTWSV